ncbi:hypothetical protein SH1V18_38430 [Vallitalea longa]|uniref:Helix-turn-helix domain-containing protein n=1 Tax=Vallitalea longa TaxID=2936439 RepID=A0A9W5YHL2_9FIRM|nr:helix-turn-helix domain-containing protein [Vallitalea longa]GKX31363.1 hypothetical protein SH1V18_38430 [Vallitalea longa]
MTKAQFLDKVYITNLKSRAVTVVFYLVNRANKEMTCFPAIKTIAKECSISERTVRRALKDLVDVGLLKKEIRWRENGGQSSNLYILQNLKDDNQKESISNNAQNKNKTQQEEKFVSSKKYIKHIDFTNYVKESVNNDGDIQPEKDNIHLKEIEVMDKNRLLNVKKSGTNFRDEKSIKLRLDINDLWEKTKRNIKSYLVILKKVNKMKIEMAGGG